MTSQFPSQEHLAKTSGAQREGGMVCRVVKCALLWAPRASSALQGRCRPQRTRPPTLQAPEGLPMTSGPAGAPQTGRDWADLGDRAPVSVRPCLRLPPGPASPWGWEVQPPWKPSALGQEGRAGAIEGSLRWGQPSLPEDLESIPVRVPKADAQQKQEVFRWPLVLWGGRRGHRGTWRSGRYLRAGGRRGVSVGRVRRAGLSTKRGPRAQ